MYPIPANATRIRWLESTGTQYIDTGVVPNANTDAEIELAYIWSYDTIQTFLNGGVTWHNNEFFIGLNGNSYGHQGALIFEKSKSTDVRVNGGAEARSGVFCNYKIVGRTAYFNGSTVGSFSKSEVNFSTSAALYIGAANRTNDGVTPGFYGKVKFCKIWQNGTLVRSFVPVRVGQVGCLFDRVTGQFFYNQGTGNFVCGEDDFSIFSYAVKHLSDTGTVLASRVMGDSSGTMKAVRKHYDMPMQYIADECNGTSPVAINTVFPSGTYSGLDYTPVRSGYSFSGWDKVLSSEIVGVEYLETSGTQYINTGIKTGLNVDYEVIFQSTGTPSVNNYFVLGGRQAMGSDENCLRYHTNSGYVMDKVYYVICDNMNGNLWAPSSSPSQNLIAKASKSGSTFSCGSTSATRTLTDFSTNVDMLLFGMMQADGAVQIAPGLRIFRAKMYVDGALVRDFTPVRVGTEGFMYDAVSKTLFGNEGTGDFIKGSDTDVSPFDPVYPEDPVSYDVEKVEARWEAPTAITFDATTNGGQMPSGWVSPDYYVGRPFGTLPVPTKTGEAFVGWVTPFGEKVTEDTLVSQEYSVLIAKFLVVSWSTRYSVTTTSSYKKTGIYSATRNSSSDPIVVDWGDGTQDVVFGNISQLVHEYSSAGSFTVNISNNIKAFQPSANNSTWYQTTSQNQYTFKEMILWQSTITSLASYSFYYCAAMTEFAFPTGVTTIPAYCFQGCNALHNVTIPSTVTSIGNYAFRSCNSSSFNAITIPASVTSINTYAFYYCSYLTSITFESSSTALTLGTYAFSYAGYQSTANSTIDMSPRKVTSIPTGLFQGCYKLKSITFPQNLTSIGQYAFRYCWYYPASTGTVTIPEGVTSTGTYAFSNCSYLTSVTLPTTLSTLGNQTFYSCTRIANIYANRTTAPTVSSATFGNSTGSYTGRNSYSAGTNKLIVPAGATGYTSSYWADPLCSSTKCGFTLEYDEQPGIYVEFNNVTSSSAGLTNYTDTLRFDLIPTVNTMNWSVWLRDGQTLPNDPSEFSGISICDPDTGGNLVMLWNGTNDFASITGIDTSSPTVNPYNVGSGTITIRKVES